MSEEKKGLFVKAENKALSDAVHAAVAKLGSADDLDAVRDEVYRGGKMKISREDIRQVLAIEKKRLHLTRPQQFTAMQWLTKNEGRIKDEKMATLDVLDAIRKDHPELVALNRQTVYDMCHEFSIPLAHKKRRIKSSDTASWKGRLRIAEEKIAALEAVVSEMRTKLASLL